jgi:D-lactate dehydrogenase
MWRIKKLFDPEGLLAPGAMLNKDPLGHVKNTHTFPEIEHVANACIEYGYCEPVCPSRHLTTTPRQRIALRREMMRHEPGSPIQKALLKEYKYNAVQTCAGDSSYPLTGTCCAFAGRGRHHPTCNRHLHEQSLPTVRRERI